MQCCVFSGVVADYQEREVENGSGRSAVGNLWEGASQVEEELVGEDYRKQHLAWTSSVSTSWCC